MPEIFPALRAVRFSYRHRNHTDKRTGSLVNSFVVFPVSVPLRAFQVRAVFFTSKLRWLYLEAPLVVPHCLGLGLVYRLAK